MSRGNPNNPPPLGIKPPRPLWQLKEELAAHLKVRPANHDILALTTWAAEKERLELWIEWCEKSPDAP